MNLEYVNLLLDNTFFGNPLRYYVILFLSICYIYFVFKLFKLFLLSRLKKFAESTKTYLDDLVVLILEKTGFSFYLALLLFFSVGYFSFSNVILTFIKIISILIISFHILSMINKSVDFISQKLNEKNIDGKKSEDLFAIVFLGIFIKIILSVIALLFIISNLGYKIDSLLAGLGIGGIAVAFALQNILRDLFASFSIYFDKPFKVGDFVVVSTDSGFIENIGLKSTRIRTLQGEELIIPNNVITDEKIHNYKQMKKRRVLFVLGVTYDTKATKLKKINLIIKEIFESIANTNLDRVNFKEFGAYSLNYEVVYYINSSNYTEYMNIQEKVNLKIFEEFEKEGIEFAYPTQTVIIEKNK